MPEHAVLGLPPAALPTGQPRVVGEPIPRIVCPEGYEAFVYASGLESADGLAFDPDGILHVAQERVGRVLRIEPSGAVTTILSGLTAPEAITFDPAGNLYALEDVEDGRLIRVDAGGGETVLATGLDAPEGAVWLPDGNLYITESNGQFAEKLPWDVVTGISRISPEGSATRVLTNTLLWSYSAIIRGADGFLYVSNDASNELLTDSIFRVDPSSGERTLLSSGLMAPEGMAFSLGGAFPLYVAEEDVGDGHGRLSLVRADGTHAPLCTGFSAVEDVALDTAGNLYVSEDTVGQIIKIIVPDLEAPRPPKSLVADPPGWTPNGAFALTWETPLDPSGIAGAYLKVGDPPAFITDGTFYAGEEITRVTGIALPGQGAFDVYLWLEDGIGNADPRTAVSTTLHYDAQPPMTVTNVPTHTRVAPIFVAWTATDSGSGVDSVSLWVRAGENGSFVDSGQRYRSGGEPTVEGASDGVFLYTPPGEGTYYFATRAVDRAGNAEPVPIGDGDAHTYCETWQRAYLPLVWKAFP
jgi:sugar lactone lactonase YvrE